MATSFLAVAAKPSNRLGAPFTIGAVLFDADGVERDSFIARCPTDGRIDPDVGETLMPAVADMSVRCGDYDELLKAFLSFAGPLLSLSVPIVAHQLHPDVTAVVDGLLRADLLSERPPLRDLASVLDRLDHDPLDVEGYNRDRGLPVRDLPPYHPLREADAVGRCWHNLSRR